jgi:hypothetical protein
MTGIRIATSTVMFSTTHNLQAILAKYNLRVPTLSRWPALPVSAQIEFSRDFLDHLMGRISAGLRVARLAADGDASCPVAAIG